MTGGRAAVRLILTCDAEKKMMITEYLRAELNKNKLFKRFLKTHN